MTPATSPARMPWRLDARGQRWFDGLLVVALLAPLLLLGANQDGPVQPVLGVLQIAPLALRRRHPAWCLLAVGAATGVQALLLDEPLHSQVAVPVAVYSVARFGTVPLAAGGLVLGLVGAGVASYDWQQVDGARVGLTEFVGFLVPIAAIVVVAWTLGTLGRVRETYVDALVARTAQAERARIARELHDVVAHGLSVIVVQADGARYAASSPTADPDLAPAALARIATTGRQALADMRQLLGLLRDGDTGTSPLPGLADLATLVGEAGGDVEARLPGADVEVSPSVELTVYRVVQESLTNVRKHAPGQVHTCVDVQVTDDGVEVIVADDGVSPASPARDDGRGQGLRGMRERVEVHGGTLEAGPRPEGGWRVHARLPR